MPIGRSLTAALVVAAMTLAACSGTTAGTPSASQGPAVVSARPSASAADSGAAIPSPVVASPAVASSPSTAPTPATVASTAPSTLLMPADVEQVSALRAIQAVPRDPTTGAGGDVNLATADGSLVVMANFGDAALYDMVKNSISFRESLAGLGDDAFIGPAKDVMKTLYIVGFRKGDHAAILATFFKGATSATMLTMDQLKALATIVASRW